MARPFTFDRVIRMLIALAITAAAVWLTGVLKNVLLPFCLACLLSYILEPFVEFNQRLLHVKGRVLAVFITLFDVALVVCCLLYFFMPTVIDEITSIEEDTRVSPLSSQVGTLPFSSCSRSCERLNLLSIIFDTSSGRNGRLIFLLIPVKYRAAVTQIANDVKESMNKYFRSQLLIATCAAVFYCIGFTIVGLPMSIVMGIVVGILYMIPYFQYITLIPVIAICFITSLDGSVDFWRMLGECGLVYVVSQCICDYILTPKIMGKSLGLNPAIILLSLSIWGTLLGIIGMIIALPLTTLILVYYKKVIIDHIPLSEPTFPESRQDTAVNNT